MIFPKCQFWYSCILYPHRFSQELKRIQKGCGRSSMTSSGRLTLLSLKNTEAFRTFPLKSAREVFGLKWPGRSHFRIWSSLISWFPNLNQGGISRKSWPGSQPGRNGSVPIMPYSWWTICRGGHHHPTGWVILSFFFLWTISITAITSKRLPSGKLT